MVTIRVKVKVEVEEEIEIDVYSDLMHDSIEEYMEGVIDNLEHHVVLSDYAEWELA